MMAHSLLAISRPSSSSLDFGKGSFYVELVLVLVIRKVINSNLNLNLAI